jgi:hypothetical protein
VETLPRRVDGIIASKGGINSILMPTILEWDVRQACMSGCFLVTLI